jgi:release factor glutamine methyltransferase
MTLREALTRATSQLDANPDLRADALRDAALLLRHSLGLTHAQLLANPEREITRDQQAAYQALIFRRLTAEPIQYLTGEQEFYGLTLRVTPAVLIPRPETELLVEAVLAEMNAMAPLRILDIGTGSGAIAITLARHLPRARVTAIDLSEAALEIAADNAQRNGVADRITFVRSDLLSAIAPDVRFDVIVSNPPYIPTSDRASLHPQVREHEPEAALFAGSDGMDIYRCLIPQAHAALRPGGLLALELGHGQRSRIAELLAGWIGVRFLDDLQKIPRVALARRAE